MITFSQLEAITGGKIIQQVTDPTVKSLAIDSRKINSPEGVLFFAIAGQRHNAHHHLQEVYQKGVRLLVVEEMIKGKDYPEANILHVSSAIHALQEVARNHRQQFKLKTIAITGSNG